MQNPPKTISKNVALKLRDFSGYPFMNTSLVNMAGEKWVALAQFDEYYLVSNMGRVKSVPRLIVPNDGHKPYYTKERVFSQYLTGTYNNHIKDYSFQLTVHLRYECLSYTPLVNRLIYEGFAGRKLNYETDKLKIVHKDGDNLNNRLENLEPSNGTHIFYNTVKRNRRPLKSRSEQTHNKKAIIQYNLKGEVLNRFPSITEAVNSTGIYRNNLGDVLNKKAIQIKGFVFRFETDPYHGEHANFSRSKKITQYSIQGEILNTFPSIAEAFQQTGISVDTISKCALHKSKFARGFVWRYEGDTYEGDFTRRELTIAVCQYDKSGELIAKFPSITSAAKSVQASGSSVRDCLLGRSRTCRGYVWRREDQPYQGEHKNLRKIKAVVKSDRAGNILGIFPNMTTAAETISLTPDAILKNITGQNHTAGGFVWRYATLEESGDEPEYVAPKSRRTQKS